MTAWAPPSVSSRMRVGHRADGVIRRPVGHAEGGCRAEIGAGRHLGHLPGRQDGPLRERAEEGRAEDSVSGLDAVDVRADGEHLARQFAARHERRRDGYLVGVRDQQRVGEVGGGGTHLNEDLVRAGRRVWQLS
jgi:hypothetical protein